MQCACMHVNAGMCVATCILVWKLEADVRFLFNLHLFTAAGSSLRLGFAISRQSKLARWPRGTVLGLTGGCHAYWLYVGSGDAVPVVTLALGFIHEPPHPHPTPTSPEEKHLLNKTLTATWLVQGRVQTSFLPPKKVGKWI